MDSIIYRYNLNLKAYDDNRTIAEVKAEIDIEPDKGVIFWSDIMYKLLEGNVQHVQNVTENTNVIYSLSMDSVTDYLIKLAGKKVA